MTNSFIVAVWVLLSTNQVDTLLTPVGDDILRSMVTVQTHVYTIPGFQSVTNAVPIATNSTRLQMRWVEVPVSDLPPVPVLQTNSVHYSPSLSNLIYKAVSLRALAEDSPHRIK